MSYDRTCDCCDCGANATAMWYLPRGQPLGAENYSGRHHMSDGLQDSIYEDWVKDGDTPSRFRGGYPVYACAAHVNSFKEAYAVRYKYFMRHGR